MYFNTYSNVCIKIHTLLYIRMQGTSVKFYFILCLISPYVVVFFFAYVLTAIYLMLGPL
jgi:hypothetical protein